MQVLTLAATLGDPRGVGPEVIEKALPAFQRDHPDVRMILVGPAGMSPDCSVDYLAAGSFSGTEISAGQVSAEALRISVQLALEGQVQGVVTGPVRKPALHSAGWTLPGQTEILKRLTNSAVVGMLMAADETRFGAPFRVLLATTHTALRNVPELLSTELLVEQSRLLRSALQQGWLIDRPRVALCALNPHASDEGLFGDEEERVYGPAVRQLREEGLAVEGPIPADTVFRRTLDGEFDAVVAPYHDVGMAAFKTVSFGRGVNVTLGLPFVRTSPDHGTALDIAGTGAVDAASMGEALRLAVRLARPTYTTR